MERASKAPHHSREWIMSRYSFSMLVQGADNIFISFMGINTSKSSYGISDYLICSPKTTVHPHPSSQAAPTTPVPPAGLNLVPTNPRLCRPVLPLPNQFNFNSFTNRSIFLCASSLLCTLASTLTHCSILPTISVTCAESIGCVGGGAPSPTRCGAGVE